MTGPAAEILTFLIADVRGYTSFTQARGDEAAARLAMTFAEIANEAVEARSGHMIELRGDEALAGFASARQALRAAVDLQLAFLDEMELDPTMPLRVGIGIDAGEAVPVADGYRGGALNLAARLCSKAEAGEILASQGVLHLARATEGLRFIERGQVEMKGLKEPVRVLQVVADDLQPADISQRMERVGSGEGPSVTPRSRTELPPELDPMTPLVGRDVDARWIRWAWRLARRGPWRAVALTGPEGVGKTRLAAEVASLAATNGARLAYASARSGGRLTEAMSATDAGHVPYLLVLEDLDASTNEDLASVAALSEKARNHTGLVVVTAHEDAPPAVMSLLRRLVGEGGIRRLEPLDAKGVREIVDLYASGTDAAGPVQAILEAARGLPAAVHDLAGRWAQGEASRRLGEATSRAAVSRTDLRAMESKVASDVVDLQRVRERTLLFGATKAPTDVCPFKGLVSFDVADTEFFFGRERLIAEMVARLPGSAFLGVVGPSGSGKSSAVRAGLVPAVGAGVLPGSEAWLRAVVRPGQNPMRSLDRAVYAALPEDARIDLSGSGDLLLAALGMLPEAGRLLLVVDQFEEAFTSCADEDERSAFFSVLARAARDDAEHVVVVVVLRADFYGRCAAYPALAELLGPNHVLVGPMTAEEYRRAIEGPARRAGLRIEPALVETLVTEVVDEPGGLPLLSTALVELWGHRDGRRIAMNAYVRTGGVKGAVGRLAEQAYAGLTEEQQTIARSVFLRLAGAGEGDSVVRRRVPLPEFDADNEDVARVLDVLTERRLVTVSEGTVEVSHEALLREWGRLQDWLEEDRQGRRLRQHLIESAKEWASADHEASELYRGARLASALDWTTEHTLELNELERDFLNQSRATSEREAERQRRANRRLRGLLVGVAVFLVLALVTGSLAVVQRGRARRSALVALSQSLGSQGVIEPRLDRGLLLAREAVGLDVSEQTRSTLLAAVLRDPEAIGVFYGGDSGRRPVGIALSPDGRTLAVQYNVQDLELFDTSSLAPKATVPSAAGGAPAFSPDGALIAVQSASVDGRLSGSIDLRDPATGQLLRTLPTDPRFGTATAIAVPEVAFSRDGDELYGLVREFRGTEVFVPKAAYILRWNITSGKLLVSKTNLGDTAASGFGLTADGRLIVSGDRTTIWDARTMVLERTLQVGGSVAMAVSPDGTTMALGDRDGSVRFVDVRTGDVTLSTGGHTARVASVGFSRDSAVITTSDDGQVLVWDVASHGVIETFAGHGGSVLAQATDGETLYTASLDGTIFAWDLSGDERFGRAFTAGSGNETPFWGQLPAFALSPDGSTLAVTQGDGYVNLWDIATLRKIRTFRAVARGSAMSVNFSPDGETLAATGSGGQLVLWDVTGGPPTSKRVIGLPHADRYSALFWAAFSPDGRTLAAGDWRQVTPSATEGELGGQRTEGYLATWNAESGDLLMGPIHLDGGVSQVVFSPDGQVMAVALADGRVPLVDVNTLKIVRTLEADTATPPTDWVSFSPDGETLATAGWAGVVRLWDVSSGRPLLHFLAAAGPVWNVGFDPSGELLVTSGGDGTTRLWDTATGKQFGAAFPGFENVMNASTFTPDGSRLVVVYANGQAFIWPATWQAWAAHACAVAGRGLTRGEWRTFVGDRPYEPVCSPGSP